jgi:hypothetical protein
LVGSPSQSAKPLAQTGTQVPDAQRAVPCGFAQRVPHTPQFDGVSRLVSQPFAGFASQSAYPAWQLGVHSPAPQAAVP